MYSNVIGVVFLWILLLALVHVLMNVTDHFMHYYAILTSFDSEHVYSSSNNFL